MIKHSNGLYEDTGKNHQSFYKMIKSSVHRYSKTLEKWILCLDEKVVKEIKLLESVK